MEDSLWVTQCSTLARIGDLHGYGSLPHQGGYGPRRWGSKSFLYLGGGDSTDDLLVDILAHCANVYALKYIEKSLF